MSVTANVSLVGDAGDMSFHSTLRSTAGCAVWAIVAALALAALWPPQSALAQSAFLPVGAPMFAPKGYVEFCERRPEQCDLDPSPAGRKALEEMIYRIQWANVLPPRPSAIGLEPAEPSLFQGRATLTASDANPTASPASEQSSSSAELEGAGLSPLRPRLALIAITPQTWADLNRINHAINAGIQPMGDVQAFGVNDYWTLPLSEGPRPVGNCKHYVLEKRKALVEAGAPASALSIAIVRTRAGQTHAVLIVATDQGDLVLDSLSSAIKGWRASPYTWVSRQVPGRSLEWASVPVG